MALLACLTCWALASLKLAVQDQSCWPMAMMKAEAQMVGSEAQM